MYVELEEKSSEIKFTKQGEITISVFHQKSYPNHILIKTKQEDLSAIAKILDEHLSSFE